jgi:hypothetical protein
LFTVFYITNLGRGGENQKKIGKIENRDFFAWLNIQIQLDPTIGFQQSGNLAILQFSNLKNKVTK